MDVKEIITWCRDNGWTEPREIENGIWVAFPPNGVIENFIPNQSLYLEENHKASAITESLYTLLLLACTFVVLFGTICITPFFFQVWKKRQNVM